MAPDRIPTEVRELLHEHVQTFEQLEVLVLLGREPEREWRLEAIASALHLSVEVGSEAIAYLSTTGLLTPAQQPSGDGFICHPPSARVLRSLVAAYDESRTDLMKLMTKLALDRIRTSALRAFSSAFLLGRKHDG